MLTLDVPRRQDQVMGYSNVVGIKLSKVMLSLVNLPLNKSVGGQEGRRGLYSGASFWHYKFKMLKIPLCILDSNVWISG